MVHSAILCSFTMTQLIATLLLLCCSMSYLAVILSLYTMPKLCLYTLLHYTTICCVMLVHYCTLCSCTIPLQFGPLCSYIMQPTFCYTIPPYYTNVYNDDAQCVYALLHFSFTLCYAMNYDTFCYTIVYYATTLLYTLQIHNDSALCNIVSLQ